MVCGREHVNPSRKGDIGFLDIRTEGELPEKRPSIVRGALCAGGKNI